MASQIKVEENPATVLPYTFKKGDYEKALQAKGNGTMHRTPVRIHRHSNFGVYPKW